MATAKKTTGTTTPKRSTKKTTTVSSSKKRTKSSPAAAAKKSHHHLRSFRLQRDQQAFFTFRITRQTVYWTILFIFIIVIQSVVLAEQVNVSNAITQLSIQTNQVTPSVHKK